MAIETPFLHTRKPISRTYRDLEARGAGSVTFATKTNLTLLAQVVMVILKTLVEKEVLDEEFINGFDLQYLLESLVDDLGAEDV